MQLDRIGLKQYVQSSISLLRSKIPEQAHEWQRDLYAGRASENEAFVARLDSTPGNSLEEVSGHSEKRGLLKVATRTLLGVAGAAALGAGFPFFGPVAGAALLVGAAGSLLVGGVSAHMGYEGEEDFRHQLKGLNQDKEAGVQPHILSGSLPSRPGGSQTEDDNLLNPLNPASPISLL